MARTASPRSTPAQRTLASRVALATRHHGPDSPQASQARAELTAEQLAEHIRRAVDQAPPLSDIQIARLRTLFSPAGNGG